MKKEDGSIEVELSVACKPNVDLGDYKSLIPAVENKEADIKDVEARLEEIAKSSAPFEKIARKRAVKMVILLLLILKDLLMVLHLKVEKLKNIH